MKFNNSANKFSRYVIKSLIKINSLFPKENKYKLLLIIKTGLLTF